jgi:hypothetical protein
MNMQLATTDNKNNSIKFLVNIDITVNSLKNGSSFFYRGPDLFEGVSTRKNRKT